MSRAGRARSSLLNSYYITDRYKCGNAVNMCALLHVITRSVILPSYGLTGGTRMMWGCGKSRETTANPPLVVVSPCGT